MALVFRGIDRGGKGERRERDDEGWAVNDTLRPSVSLSPLWSHAYMTSSREGRMAMLGVEVVK